LARKRALAGDLAVFEESRRAVSESAKGLDEQLVLMKQELAGLRALAAEQYVPRNQHFAAERQFVELTNTAQRTRSQAAELQLRSIQRQQEYRREVETQLADTTRESALAAERLRSAEEELKRTVVKAPESGQVVGLFSQMAGAVISPGQRLMDIVPKGEALMIEVRVAPNLIDQLTVGLTADINLHAFVDQMQLRIDGKVISVAGDLLTEQGPMGPVPYYLVRIQVTPEGIKALGKHQLQPGMPVEVVIKTGERTMLNYVMRPLLHRLHSSLTES
jgi:protease secretion system membrane fusion protein